MRLAAMEHGKWGDDCAIYFLVEVAISRGQVDISDATFKLFFRSSQGKRDLRVLSFSPLQRLGDVTEVQRQEGTTGNMGFRLGNENMYVDGRGERRAERQWTELDQYKLEADNAGDTLLTARLWRVGTEGTVPSRFKLQVVVACPRGKGVDITGDLVLGDSKEAAVGGWREVLLDEMKPHGTDFAQWGDADFSKKVSSDAGS